MAAFTPADRVLAVNGGSFGARFVQLCQIHGVPVTQIELRPGQALTPGHLAPYEGQGYTIAMPGRHQLQNARTALRALNALRERGWNIPIEAAVRGLARARIAGRLERVVDQPLILLDGAHNAAGADALCHAVDELLKMKRLHVVMGMVRDKDYATCVHQVARRADDFYACVPDAGERSLDAHTIAELARQSCKSVYECDSAEHAIELALERGCMQQRDGRFFPDEPVSPEDFFLFSEK